MKAFLSVSIALWIYDCLARNMAVNPGALEQASFLHPREPSITGWDQRLRFVEPVRKQLFNEILEEEEESAKPEKAGINTYLRLKPSPAANEQV